MNPDKLQIASVNGTTLHWREDGNHEGLAVVFANSLGTDLRVWDAIVELLPADVRCIRFDNRGHGLSGCPEAPYTIDELCEDTAQLLDHLSISRCLFVGLSIGGLVGQALASHRPDLVKALVLSNTFARTPDKVVWQRRIAAVESGGLEYIADAVIDRWFGSAFKQRSEAALWRNMLTRTPAAGYIGCCYAIAEADLTEQSARLRLPVTGIAGGEDSASPPELVSATVESITGSSFHIIEGAGHLPCVENPHAYAERLNEFINENRHV